MAPNKIPIHAKSSEKLCLQSKIGLNWQDSKINFSAGTPYTYSQINKSLFLDQRFDLWLAPFGTKRNNHVRSISIGKCSTVSVLFNRKMIFVLKTEQCQNWKKKTETDAVFKFFWLILNRLDYSVWFRVKSIFLTIKQCILQVIKKLIYHYSKVYIGTVFYWSCNVLLQY